MSVDKQGYLSKELDSVTEKNKNKFLPYFSLFEKLNEFAQDTVFLLEVNKQNLQQITLAALYLRILSSYQTIYLLSEKGLNTEAKIILRALFENVFRFVAIIKHPELAKQYVYQDLYHQKKTINKLFEDDPSLKKVEKLTQITAENKRKIEEDNIQELGIIEYADKAGLMSYYRIDYTYLCSSAHSNIRDVDKLFVFDTDSKFSSFKWGPNDFEIDFALFGAINCLLIVLQKMNEVFKIIDEKRYLSLHSEFEELEKSYLDKHKNT